MTPYKIAAILLAGLGLITAMIAAAYWWKASRVNVATMSVSITDAPQLHIISTQSAFYESSRLNSRAAIWTGLAALLSAAASVVGVLPE